MAENILNGHDNDLYIVIGELDDESTKEHKNNMALNFKGTSRT